MTQHSRISENELWKLTAILPRAGGQREYHDQGAKTTGLDMYRGRIIAPAFRCRAMADTQEGLRGRTRSRNLEVWMTEYEFVDVADKHTVDTSKGRLWIPTNPSYATPIEYSQQP